MENFSRRHVLHCLLMPNKKDARLKWVPTSFLLHPSTTHTAFIARSQQYHKYNLSQKASSTLNIHYSAQVRQCRFVTDGRANRQKISILSNSRSIRVRSFLAFADQTVRSCMKVADLISGNEPNALARIQILQIFFKKKYDWRSI